MQQLRATTEGGSAQSCAREVLDTVPPVVWFIRREMRVFRKELSLVQFRTLVLVNKNPAASLSAIADHLGSSLPTASRLVQGLVEQGLLARQGCPEDRRQLALAITDSGRAVLHTAWAGTQRRLAEQLKVLSPDQRQAVIDAMGLLKSVFGSLGLTEAQPAATNGAARTTSPSDAMTTSAEFVAQD
jgi:DNA-binding MarR family transcriptional regulator